MIRTRYMVGWFIGILISMTSCGPKIVDRPIIFDDLRKELSLQYLRDHYGLEQDSPVIDPQMIVVHWTAIPTLEGSFNAFRDPELPHSRTEIAGAGSLNVSTHFLVDRDGTIYRLMLETMMGRHVIGLNHVAIGIENVGGTSDAPLTEKQLKSNVRLIEYLTKKYNIQYLLGHYEYQHFEDHELWLERNQSYRTIKTDPGKGFMKALREETSHLEFEPVPKKNGNED